MDAIKNTLLDLDVMLKLVNVNAYLGSLENVVTVVPIGGFLKRKKAVSSVMLVLMVF